MSRWVAYKDKHIKLISDKQISNSELTILEVSDNLKDIPNKELLTNYIIRNGKLVNKNDKIPAKELKIAIITNIYQKCGISTYSENLLDPLLKEVREYRIFAEINDLATDVEKKWPITQCWQRAKPTVELIQKIKQYNPDIVLCNHEWGLFPDAKYWLSLLTQLSDYRIITTLHSVFPEHRDKTICEAAISEIIVHSDGAKQALEKKGIKSKIYVIPHGCYAINDQPKLWNMYRSQHTFIQSGFGFQYKGMPTSIKAAAILKDKYPDVFLTILFSESPFNKGGHQSYYEELIQLIDQLNIQENVAIVRGYQSDEVISAYYRTNKVAVFPYQSQPGHLVFGSSGAARLAMSFQIPVISSSIPHFQDLPTIKAETAEQIANELDKLFTNQATQKAQIEKQNKHIEANNWEKTARKYLDIFEGGVIL